LVSLVKIRDSKFVTVQESAYYRSFFLQSNTSGLTPSQVIFSFIFFSLKNLI